MIKLRDLFKQIEPDHQFRLSQEESELVIPSTKITMACSCGWGAHRYVTNQESISGFSSVLTTCWYDNERFQHLLDQEVDV